MKLTRISASNLKGETFQHDLTETVAIIGANFAGKSAVIEAIRLALLGYLAEVGKLPKASWELSSGQKMSVLAEFDNGYSLTRNLQLEGSIVKTYAVESSPGNADRLKDLPLLSPELYFEMTASERVNYVFSMIKLPGSYTAEGIIAEVERLSFGEEHTEQIERAKAEAVVEIRAEFRAPTIQEALSDAIEIFRERFTYWNRRAKETQGAVKTLTELKLREKECTADSIRQLDAELAEAQEELDKLNREKGKLVAKEDEAARNLGRKRQIQKILKEDRVDYEKMLADLREKIATSRFASVPSAEEFEQLKAKRTKVSSTLDRVHAETEQRNKNVALAKNRLSDLDGLKECPFCRSKGKGWRENLEKELSHTVTTQTKLRSEGEKLVHDLSDELVELSERIDQIGQDVGLNVETQRSIYDWERDQARLLEAAKKEEKYRAELHEEIAQLNALPDELSLETQLAEVERKRQAVTIAWRNTDESKKTALNLQQDLKRAAQAQLEHQDADAHLTVIKAVAALLKQKQSDMTTEAFTGLLKTANAICGNILKSPLAFHEDTVGRWESAKFIPHRVFSGMEKKLTYVAIAAALSAQAPLKLMLVDEMGLATGAVQGLVMMNLKKAVADGLIDQVIVVIPSDVKVDIPGWQVIWVCEPVKAVDDTNW